MPYTRRMAQPNLAAERMRNQMITRQSTGDPAEVLRWMVAIQAQDYFGALWALGLRTRKASIIKVEQAFADGRILRTHVMRPTWHFVAAEDIRWLVRLTAPRVHALSAYYYKQQKLDAREFSRAHKAMERALRTHGTQTREELGAALAQAGIEASGLRLAYIVMHAELELLLCSGPRRGKQFTYALIDERAPAEGKPMSRDQALAQFAARFYASRGPANPRDFAYWSGLTLADAKAGLQAVAGDLKSRTIDGTEYWSTKAMSRGSATGAHLLSNYDEFGMSYKDLGAVYDRELGAKLFNYAYTHLVIVNGRLAGSWRRVIGKKELRVETRPIRTFSAADHKLIEQAAQRYASFLGTPVKVVHGKPLLTR